MFQVKRGYTSEATRKEIFQEMVNKLRQQRGGINKYRNNHKDGLNDRGECREGLKTFHENKNGIFKIDNYLEGKIEELSQRRIY